MKNLFIILVLVLFSVIVYADDTPVFLDLSGETRHEYNYSSANYDIKSSGISGSKENEDYIYHPMKYIFEEGRELYSSKKVTDKKEKNIGKTTLGIKSDTTLNPDSISQKRTLYANQKITEKMSVNSSYETNSNDILNNNSKGSVGIGPEYKLNRKIKLKNKFSKNLENNSNKGEVSIECKPFQDDRFDFNAGAAQVQRDNGNGSSSQVNFGTNIRF